MCQIYYFWKQDQFLKFTRLPLFISPIVAGFIVLTLAILNPLACLIHCATLHTRAQLTHAFNMIIDDASFYLCDMAPPVIPALASVNTGYITTAPIAEYALPHAFYEGVVGIAVILALVIFFIAFFQQIDTRFSSYMKSPPAPPPRYVRCSL